MTNVGEAVPLSVSATQPPARERIWYPYLLIAPSMLTLTVVSLIPFLYTVYLSVHAAKFGRVADFVGAGNYITLLTDPRFWNSIGTAVIFVAIAVPIEFMLGLVGALVLNQNVRGRSILIPLLFMPTMMAPIVVGLLWKIMLAGSWGLISYNVLERFHLIGQTSIFASSDLALTVTLPPDATSSLVFTQARAAGVQVRGLGVRRESLEAAFLRVIGEEAR